MSQRHRTDPGCRGSQETQKGIHEQVRELHKKIIFSLGKTTRMLGKSRWSTVRSPSRRTSSSTEVPVQDKAIYVCEWNRRGRSPGIVSHEWGWRGAVSLWRHSTKFDQQQSNKWRISLFDEKFIKWSCKANHLLIISHSHSIMCALSFLLNAPRRPLTSPNSVICVC